jgi:hypothetical protein
MKPEQSALLRQEFPASVIGKLPKGGVFLDYVGHAAVTDRLLAVDPEWTWEPVALDERGLPRFDESGGLWIRLTIAGVTRLGYGDAAGKKGANAVKEAIGDAIRNAAMRFGVALDLWAKEDLSQSTREIATPEKVAAIVDAIEQAQSLDELHAIGEQAKSLQFDDVSKARLRNVAQQRAQAISEQS